MSRRKLPIAVTRAEAYAIMAAAKSSRDRMLVKLLWYTGGRISEVLAARVGDLHVEANGLRLRNLKQGSRINGRHVADASADKMVFMPAAFVQELVAFTEGLPPDAYILARPDGKPYTSRRLAQIVEGAAAGAGVYKVRALGEKPMPAWPHTFRHGHAVNLLLSGAPITAVQGQLGHAGLDATEVYTRLTDAERRAAVTKAGM